MKCYYASYNVGNVEVWSSELYSDKDSVFEEIAGSAEDSTALTETDSEVFDIAAGFAGYSTITPFLLDTTDDAVLQKLKKVW